MTKRVPRPKGTTLQCKALYHSNNPSNITLKQIHRHLLNQYFLDNQHLNGQYYSVDQIALYLNIPTLDVIRYMNKHLGYLQGFGNANLEDIHGMLREMLFRAANGSLHHSRQAQNQYDLLYKAQDGKYTPYLTEQVNKALSNLFAADQNLMAFIRLAMPQGSKSQTEDGTYSPFFANQNKAKGTEQSYLTTEAAVGLLEARDLPSLLGSAEGKQALFLEHKIGEMPEVRANFQSVSSTDKTPTEDLTDDAEEVEDKHIDRRVKEFEDVDEIQ